MHGFFEREFILLLRIFFINSFYGHASIVKFFAHLVQFLFLFSLRLIIILLLLLLFFFSFIFLYLEHNISIISAAAMKHGEVCSIFTRFIKSIFSDSCSEVIIVDNVDIYIYITFFFDRHFDLEIIIEKKSAPISTIRLILLYGCEIWRMRVKNRILRSYLSLSIHG